jgi:hypothetical protein
MLKKLVAFSTCIAFARVSYETLLKCHTMEVSETRIRGFSTPC